MYAPDRTVLLADHSTFGRGDFARVVPRRAGDTIITDAELGQRVEDAGPRMVVV